MYINVFVSETYKAFLRPISSTIEQILEVAGWKTNFLDDPSDADLIYCSKSSSSIIPCVSLKSWRNMHESFLVNYQDLLVPNLSTFRINQCKQIDYIYVVYYFLSGSFEENLELHPNSFVPIYDSEFCKAIGRPNVQKCISKVQQLLIEKKVCRPAPRWPIGKKWALCLSHDCDRINKFRTSSHFGDSLVHLKNKNIVPSIKSFSYANISTLANFVGAQDPYWESWSKWIEFQKLNEIKSTYFVCTWNRFNEDSSMLDVDYNCFDKKLYRLVRDLHEDGFDIGLHSSIHAWDFRRYDKEVEKFEAAFGFEPRGYRGHYWSLSYDNPNNSMKLAKQSSCLVYSSCLGMNLHSGYRRGICYPYRHFDKTNGEYAGNWEVPPIMMDQSLLLSITENYQIKKIFKERVSEIKFHNGCFVLDWHSDSLSKGYMNNITESLLTEIQNIVSDSECWITSISDLVEWTQVGRWKVITK